MTRDKLLTLADRFFDLATRLELLLAALAVPVGVLLLQGSARAAPWFLGLALVALTLILLQGIVLAVCTRAISTQVEREARKNPVHVDGATGQVISQGRKGYRNFKGGTPPGPKAAKRARAENPLHIIPLGQTIVKRPN